MTVSINCAGATGGKYKVFSTRPRHSMMTKTKNTCVPFHSFAKVKVAAMQMVPLQCIISMKWRFY